MECDALHSGRPTLRLLCCAWFFIAGCQRDRNAKVDL
jgi:hypothetical protein